MTGLQLMPTGIPNLDEVLGGGVPVYSLNILAGSPGSGKTVLAQQLMFHFIRQHANNRALYLTTLSEPVVKVVRYMQHFSFFDEDAFGEQVLYQDIGDFIQNHSLTEVVQHIRALVETHHPQVLVIDSFKAIRDLIVDISVFRCFCFDLSVQLASSRCTTFLVGEYCQEDISEGAEFAVADGIIFLRLATIEEDPQRFLQVYKLRGQATQLTAFPFLISQAGMRVLCPRLSLNRREISLESESETAATGIRGLDALLRGGLPRGRSILISGVSGTGKTTLTLQFLIEGAKQGERGLLFSFEETPDRLQRMAKRFGWDLDLLQQQNLLRIRFVPQPLIEVETHLEMMMQEMDEFQPQRLVVDSFSVFLNRVRSAALQREKTYQMATLVQRQGATGLLISDIPAGEPGRLSRFGVEETVTDGTIVLSTEISQNQRRRYLEVYKLRATEHVTGRHRMAITPTGVEVFYHAVPTQVAIEQRPLTFSLVQPLLLGEIRYGSAWVVRGEQGVGKSTLAYQFALEGLRHQEGVLLIATDMAAFQAEKDLESWGAEVTSALASGQLCILDTRPVNVGDDFLDLTDSDRFLFQIERFLRIIPKPCRVIIDSMTPIALQYPPAEFLSFIERKNRLLRQPNVAQMDLFLSKTLDENVTYSLQNSYDIVMEIYIPDWGAMGQGGQGLRVLQIRKARGSQVDTRPYPYTIKPGEGIVLQKGFYGEDYSGTA